MKPRSVVTRRRVVKRPARPKKPALVAKKFFQSRQTRVNAMFLRDFYSKTFAWCFKKKMPDRMIVETLFRRAKKSMKATPKLYSLTPAELRGTIQLALTMYKGKQ